VDLNNDYTSFTETSDSTLAELADLAAQQIEAERVLADTEAQVAVAKRALREIKEVKIPELMDSVGMGEFTTTTGLKIKVKETIRAKISKANAVDAFAWLRENGHEALIKRQVTIMFGRGEDAEAAETIKALEERELPVDDTSSVHASTLTKFVCEKLEAGEDVPMELLGVHRQRVSAVTV
jgi:hypothetical protein